MASDYVTELTDANFDEITSGEGPVLVDLWAEWCGPCRMLGPVIEQIAQEYDGKVTVAKVDVDANQQTAATLGISSIPTVLLYQNGELRHQWVGVQPKDVYTDALDDAVAATA